MRKLLYTLAGLAALATLASCNKEAKSPTLAGERVTATFTVTAPDAVATKAIADGSAAKDFYFAVYDEAGNYLEGLSKTMADGGAAEIVGTSSPWKVTIPVVKDMTYQFVFLAKSASDNGFCTFNAANANVTVNYSALLANDDNADFFYVKDKITIENDFSKTETMTRPLAQINIGASDLTAAGYSIKTDATMLTGISLTGINNTLNVLDGSLSGAADVELAKAKRVNETSQFVTGYDRIAMAYVLAGASQTSNATINISAEGLLNTTPHTITRSVSNIPLQGNYRTNILGNIFTSNFTFTVQTEADFYTPEYVEQAGMTIAKANTAFANGQTSVTIDTDPETAGAGSPTTIILPATNDPVRIRLNFTTTQTISIQYTDGATDTQKPSELELFAKKVSAVVADLPSTTVTVSAGSLITTGTFATAPTTLIIESNAEVTNLKIKAGNVKLEKGSKVTSIARADGNADVKTIVEVEGGLASYPSLEGSNIEFKKNITGVTIEKTETKATYSVSAEAIPETALEAIVQDINDDPKESVSIEMAPNSSFEWKTGGGHGSTPVIPESNTVTKEVVVDGGGTGVFVATGAGVGDIRATGDGTLIFKNLTIVDHSVSYTETSWEFGYLEYSGKVTFENCTFLSSITLESDNDTDENIFTFTDCKFIGDTEASDWNPEPEKMYLVWVSSGKSTFTNCEFTGYRALKMHEAYGSNVDEVIVEGCTFHDISKKPGIAIGTIDASTKVSVTNSSFIRCQPGDQGLYAYESDTNVDTFNFTFENNEVLLTEGVSILGASSYGLTSPVGLAYATENLFTKGGTFTLVNDIDMTGVEYKAANVGKGITIDGNGKTISNIDITAADGKQAGLIGRIAAPVTIKNLTIDGGTVTGTNNMDGEYSAGALIGWLEVHSNWTVDVLNCTVKNLTVNSCKYVGGLIGYESANKCLKIDGCSVIDCVLNSEYTEDGGSKFKGHCGGVVGYLEQGNIDNTLVSGVTLSGKGERFGALAGSAQASAVLGGGNKVSNVTIKGVKVTDKSALTGAVDARTDKSHDDAIIIE